MTRALAAALTLALLALPGCQVLGPQPAADGPTQLERILAAGELRVGVSADLPPLNMKDKRGNIIGLEIDLIRALGDAMGLRVRLVEQPFAELLPTLERGEVDLVISGLTITPERNSRVAFAGPYFVSGTSVLSKSRALANVESARALDDPARTYAALASSTSERFVRDQLPRAKLVTTLDYETAVQMVIDERVDALIADFQICTLSVWRHPDAGLSAMMTPFTVEPLGIALPPRAPLLLNLVSNYLNTLERTGLLAQFKAKWLADGSWISELP